MNNKKNKNIFIALAVVVTLLLVSLVLYSMVRASNDNQIKIKSAKITAIKTGSQNFDTYDGTNNTVISNSSIENYVAGNDSSDSNRIVRSFDTITYNFEYLIADKNSNTEHYDKTVAINVELSDEEAKYVTFDPDAAPGEVTKVYTFDGISTTDRITNSITLYVLGAPNGTTINPKFNIR